MGWLSSWLQDLIMIVLLATFVDMLLPNRSMERYVKLVLSLLILLTLLSPITKLLRSDPIGELKRAMSAMDAPSDGQATLEQILAKGRQMQANEQQQSLQWTAKELANVMKGQIEDTTGAKVQSVEVQLAMKKQSTDAEIASSVDLPVIQRVVVQMAGVEKKESGETAQVDQPIFATHETNEDEANQPGSQPIQIQPIEISKVQVESRDQFSNSNPTSTHQTSEPAAARNSDESNDTQSTSASRSEHAVRIITLLTEQWKIDASQVQVTEAKHAEVL
ncbi:stage III sporulation protein AF [Paenibacillus barcinonensis]|uniref:stage III sporulation protein AF n=1 Tax=Paenibacillus barcinonensis TaxID=198119 RepID=UPI001C120069|nr:stage III sporulation protein AF [Paenibacillus barcinonensis]MBU5352519.1 stage III sporulation protein AF [Paenibacillus barcinonensis]